jgi:hypothetical protein
VKKKYSMEGRDLDRSDAPLTGTTTTWAGNWTAQDLVSGDGFIVTGKIQSKRSHNVTVTDSKQFPTNFLVLVLELTEEPIRRRFEGGREVAPHTKNERTVVRGYLTQERQKV